MLIKGLILAGLAAGALNVASAGGFFSEAERENVMKFWSKPGRYSVRLPKDAPQNGPFQVRLTTGGSVWLREYNRKRGLSKVPPTATAQPQNEQQRVWQKWIDAKIEWDRWCAMSVADQVNWQIVGRTSKFDDKTLPQAAPANPGVAPQDLIDFAGSPPAFAEAVVPMLHEITFDDGTVVAFQDNRKMRKNYAYYRFEKGVASEGVSVRSMPASKLDSLFEKAGVSPAEARVMKSVSILEGGFDAINTYDTGYVSVGFIQFATLKDGGNSLGEMLYQYKRDLPDSFNRDFRRFGLDVTEDARLACLDLETGAELTGEAAARKVIDDRRLIAVFQYDGLKSDTYNAMQIRAAKSQFFPADDVLTLKIDGQTLSGKVSDVIRSEAGMATLMDRKVNTGKLDPLVSTLTQVAQANGVTRFEDLALFEYDIVQALRYRRDYLADSGLSQPTSATRSKPLPSRSGSRSGRGSRRSDGGRTGGQSPSEPSHSG